MAEIEEIPINAGEAQESEKIFQKIMKKFQKIFQKIQRLLKKEADQPERSPAPEEEREEALGPPDTGADVPMEEEPADRPRALLDPPLVPSPARVEHSHHAHSARAGRRELSRSRWNLCS